MNGARSRWYFWVSGFFLLDTMQAFGFIYRMIYGSWDGKAATDHANPELADDCGKPDVVRHQLPPDQEGHCHGQRPRLLGGRVPLFYPPFGRWTRRRLRVAIVYLFVIIGAIGIARTLDADEFMHLLGWCCFLLLLRPSS